MEMINIPAGLLGYRGVWGANWTEPRYPATSDWGGGYVATEASDAVGYIVAPTGTESGTGTLFQVDLQAPMPGVLVPQGEEPDVAAIRVFVEKNGYDLDSNLYFIDALSAVGLAYVGPSAERAYEVVLSGPLLQASTVHRRVATVTVTRGLPDYNHIQLTNGPVVSRDQLDRYLPNATFVP